MDIDKETLFGADVRINGLELVGVEGGKRGEPELKLAVNRLETDSFAGTVNGLSYRAEQLSIDRVQTTLGRGQLSAEAADLTGLRASSEDGNLSLSVGRIGFTSGLLHTAGEELFAPHACIEDARLVIKDLDTLFAGAAGSGEAKDPNSEHKAAKGEPTKLDWHFLDVVQGKLDLDLVVDMTLPWIGRRRTTHYFRVPIENGTIDYERLEGDVHWLEGAFLTLDLVGDKLVLARDMPLVPISGKALLEWPLAPEDIPVAQYHRVHLRNAFFGWRLPQKGKKKDKDRDKGDKDKESVKDKGKDKEKEKSKSKLTLHALSMENVHVALASQAPARIELGNGGLILLGDEQHPGLTGLTVSGALRFNANQPTEPTTLWGRIELLDMTIKDVDLGAAVVSADRLHLGGIDKVAIGFEGFKPRSLELYMSRVTATNLRLKLRPEQPAVSAAASAPARLPTGRPGPASKEPSGPVGAGAGEKR